MKSLEPGDLVLAETMLGFWLRSRVDRRWTKEGLRVRYGAPEVEDWLPRLMAGDEVPAPGDVMRWARVVHQRLLGDDALEA